MGQFFSKKKPQVTDVDRAILTLKHQRRKLADYQKKVEAVIEREREIIKELIKEKKKDRAILALKRKRVQEEALKKADVWVMNVEQQLADIEITSRQKAVFESLKSGQQAVKELQSHISLEDVQMLMDESADARVYQQEVESLVSQQLTEEDEEAVMAELEKLEIELGLEGLEDLEVPEEELPSVPAKPVVVKEDVTIDPEDSVARPISTEKVKEEPLAA